MSCGFRSLRWFPAMTLLLRNNSELQHRTAELASLYARNQQTHRQTQIIIRSRKGEPGSSLYQTSHRRLSRDVSTCTERVCPPKPRFIACRSSLNWRIISLRLSIILKSDLIFSNSAKNSLPFPVRVVGLSSSARPCPSANNKVREGGGIGQTNSENESSVGP